MTDRSRVRARVVDGLLIAMMILPFVGCILLKILFTPASDGITIAGPQIYLTVPMPLQPLYISESTVVSAAVVIAVIGLCLYLTHGIKEVPDSKRQLVAEFIVEKVTDFVGENMGARFIGFAPFVAAILALSALSSMSSLFGLYSPTSDINIVAGWAVLVFILITHYKLRGGLGNYLKSFGDPIPIFYPFNVISEIATPVSMTFRHYGNILSGAVISTLIATVLAKLSNLILSLTHNFYIANIPFLRVGLPAVLSLYFDVFSSVLQAYIFAMLTMLFISGGYPEEAVEKRREKRAAKKAAKEAKKSEEAAAKQ